MKQAMQEADPKSSSFWEIISKKVKEKNAVECREKWFEMVTSPEHRHGIRHTTHPSKQPNISQSKSQVDDTVEDDIFDSTPFRKGFQKRNSDETFEEEQSKFLGSPIIEDTESVIIRNTAKSDENDDFMLEANSHNNIVSPIHFRTGYKSYVNQVRKGIRDVEQTEKKKVHRRKKITTKGTIKATIEAGDVYMEGKLSPGGTMTLDEPTDLELEDMVILSDGTNTYESDVDE